MTLASLKAKVRVVPPTESTRLSKAAKELLEAVFGSKGFCGRGVCESTESCNGQTIP